MLKLNIPTYKGIWVSTTYHPVTQKMDKFMLPYNYNVACKIKNVHQIKSFF